LSKNAKTKFTDPAWELFALNDKKLVFLFATLPQLSESKLKNHYGGGRAKINI
jgi:hypothetical protein